MRHSRIAFAVFADYARLMGMRGRQRDSRRNWAASLLASSLLLMPVTVLQAQTALDGLRERDQELEQVRARQKQAADTELKLRQEIQSVGEDRRKLNQALIDTAARLRMAEAKIAESEARLVPLDESERDIRVSLTQRRAAIVEVLAALQRIGRSPPPALLVRPEDALSSVRTAIMLGAVVPDMRVQVESLSADIGDLVRIRRELAQEKDKLERESAVLAEERRRVTLLSQERQKKQVEAERALDAERQTALLLSRQAESLKDLISSAERSLDGAGRAARAAARSSEERPRGERVNLAALSDPGRLTPGIAFASAKGVLPMPVNGVRLREFGAPDKIGGTERGLTLATRAGAQVTAPCDGWIVYAGTFRNYGQVLILNAGGGYHVVLAGMERITVDVGQFVLTGEPIAMMGNAPVASTLAASTQPALYVEFRRDGTPIDPSPWWASTEGEKVRG